MLLNLDGLKTIAIECFVLVTINYIYILHPLATGMFLCRTESNNKELSVI